MNESRVVYLKANGRAEEAASQTSRVLAAFSVALRRLPSRPMGFPACVSHLQDDAHKLASRPVAVRTLLRFREALFCAPGRELEMRQLWRESLATACTARMIATALGGNAPLLTGAGLLHRLGEVIALRALAEAELYSGQRLPGTAVREMISARDEDLVARASGQWALADELRDIIVNWRTSTLTESRTEAGRQLMLAQLFAFEQVHAGQNTPGVVETACADMGISAHLPDDLRATAAGIDALLIRAGPTMGPVARLN
jgi:HDOD domain